METTRPGGMDPQPSTRRMTPDKTSSGGRVAEENGRRKPEEERNTQTLHTADHGKEGWLESTTNASITQRIAHHQLRSAKPSALLKAIKSTGVEKRLLSCSSLRFSAAGAVCARSYPFRNTYKCSAALRDGPQGGEVTHFQAACKACIGQLPSQELSISAPRQLSTISRRCLGLCACPGFESWRASQRRTCLASQSAVRPPFLLQEQAPSGKGQASGPSPSVSWGWGMGRKLRRCLCF
uniref:Uncharacterized protein n=1 Tax=Sphaerodactylus townsendi TaxID=933632 RepID=A0ACB8F6X3_9SAUR